MKSACTRRRIDVLLRQRGGVSLSSALQRRHYRHHGQHHHPLQRGLQHTSNRSRTRNNSNIMLMLKQYKTTMTRRTTSTTTTTTPTTTASAIVTATTTTTPTATTTTTTTRASSLARRAWNSYSHSLNERPLLTKAVLASIIFFTSDSVTQYLVVVCNTGEAQLFEWNATRALSGASFGIIATGWLHYWWGFLETAVGKRVPTATHKLANTACKVVLDQSMGAPLYIYSYYVLTNFWTHILSRDTHANADANANSTTCPGSLPLWDAWKHTNAKAADMLWPTMLQHWRVWVPVHSINFYCTPLHHRVLVQNSVLVFWSGYLSHLNHQDIVLSPAEEMDEVSRKREATTRTTTTTTRAAAAVSATTTTTTTTATTE